MTAPEDPELIQSYSTDMFLVDHFAVGPIVTMDRSGRSTLFSAVAAGYIKFGPEGDWGSLLYSADETTGSIVVVLPDGTHSVFSGGFTAARGFDWAFGPGFGGDMFATDAGADAVYRIKPDGSRSLWATLDFAFDVSFCHGALYITNFSLGMWKVTACPWDCGGEGDGIVGTADLLVLLSQWGLPGFCDFDINGTGTSDLLELLANWGPCP